MLLNHEKLQPVVVLLPLQDLSTCTDHLFHLGTSAVRHQMCNGNGADCDPSTMAAYNFVETGRRVPSRPLLGTALGPQRTQERSGSVFEVRFWWIHDGNESLSDYLFIIRFIVYSYLIGPFSKLKWRRLGLLNGHLNDTEMSHDDVLCYAWSTRPDLPAPQDLLLTSPGLR